MSINGHYPRNRARFNLTHTHKLSCKDGLLVPCLCEQVLPGDKWKISSDVLIRMLPQLHPTMSRFKAYWWYFFVPYRLIFDKWEDFITGGKKGDDASVLPYVNAGADGFAVSSLADYLGFPTKVKNLNVSALPFRAYDLIYNEFFRDENLIDELPISELEGLDTVSNVVIQRKAWRKDRFTNALPFAQRGNPVYLPLAQDAPVIGSGLLGIKQVSGTTPGAGDFSGPVGSIYKGTEPLGATGPFLMTEIAPDAARFGVSNDASTSGLKADLSATTAASIDDVRQAFNMQNFAYMLGVYGYRYVEYLKSLFGTDAGDARLQRPEFLGSGSTDILISEVLQTSSTDNTSPQGNMSGHGIGGGRGRFVQRRFKEHGIVMGIMSIIPDAEYMQGIRRQWLYETRFDFYNPIFAHAGMQPVLNAELYAQGTDDDKGTFGFRNCFDELRSIPNYIHGEFRTSLLNWTEARSFDALPKLNKDFVECKPSDRIFAVPDGDNWLVAIKHNITADRPVPKRGNPGFVDHY